MNKTDHPEMAKQLFMEGYNCAQSVFCAFDDVTGIDRETSSRLASSFGAGMGRMREVCGTVSGALMVLGIACGYDDPKDLKAKSEHYKLVRDFADRFRKINGSIICRELLSEVKTTEGGEPEERTDEYYKKRPCPELCYIAASIVDELLEPGNITSV